MKKDKYELIEFGKWRVILASVDGVGGVPAWVVRFRFL